MQSLDGSGTHGLTLLWQISEVVRWKKCEYHHVLLSGQWITAASAQGGIMLRGGATNEHFAVTWPSTMCLNWFYAVHDYIYVHKMFCLLLGQEYSNSKLWYLRISPLLISLRCSASAIFAETLDADHQDGAKQLGWRRFSTGGTGSSSRSKWRSHRRNRSEYSWLVFI